MRKEVIENIISLYTNNVIGTRKHIDHCLKNNRFERALYWFEEVESYINIIEEYKELLKDK